MADETRTGKPEPIREPIYPDPFDPGRIRLYRDKTGRLRLTIQDDRTYLDVRAARAFPISDPDHHIGLLDGRDRCIGMLNDLEGLDEESRRLVEEALANRYFVPVITRVHRLTEEFGVVYCNVETDRGHREFIVRGLRDNLEDVGDGELMVTDTDGIRYRIRDWRELDERSRAQLECFI